MFQIIQQGGPLMWPLLLCSVVSVGITIERFIFWWRFSRQRDEQWRRKLLEILQRQSPGEELLANVQELAASHPGDVLARIVQQAIHCVGNNWQAKLEVAAAEEVEHMKRGLDIQDTIITLAPLLGILGTVLGIINSFHLLGSKGVIDPKLVTGGIAQALITTAAGLTVAILTLIPFNYFVNRVKQNTHDINRYLMLLSTILNKEKGGEVS
ncbi:MAG: MotA/TolQ/ExbB proton channel family protein [Lentisphaerae bacterium]|nr:MAG: MotA/TolQ/ExbB proton channel family protein [Lentisphaerota bacterium]